MYIILFLELRNDISNSVHHILGYHNKCAAYFCSGPKVSEINLVPEAEKNRNHG